LEKQKYYWLSCDLRTRMKSFICIKLFTLLGVLLSVLFVSNAALPTSVSASPPTPKLVITTFNGTGSTAMWVNDPPNAEFDGFYVSISTVAGSFGGVFYHGVKGLTLNQLNHLGFDIEMISTGGGSPSFAAGAPRLSITLSNGVTLFPDPFYCSDISSSASATTYVHFDVVTDGSNCTVFANTSGTTPVGFWADVLSLYGTVHISRIIMVQDDPYGTLRLGNLFAGCASVTMPSPSPTPITC
jgi:hypothetical protein